MGTVPYSGLSVDKPTAQKIRELAKSEGFPSTSSFIRYLVEVYPTLKRIKEMFDKGLLVPATQVQIATQDQIPKSQSLPERQLPLPVCGNSYGMVIDDQAIADKLASIIFDIFMNPDKYTDKVFHEFYEDDEFVLIDFRCMTAKRKVKRPMVVDKEMKISKLARLLKLESYPKEKLQEIMKLQNIALNSLGKVIEATEMVGRKAEMKRLKVVVKEEDTEAKH